MIINTKFNVGDRVFYVDKSDKHPAILTGKVVEIDFGANGLFYLIDYEDICLREEDLFDNYNDAYAYLFIYKFVHQSPMETQN